MNRLTAWLLNTLSLLLDPDERIVVLGDFAESGAGGSLALAELLGLIIRRQAALWKNWRPWIAPVALLAPVLLLLNKPPYGGLQLGWIGRQVSTYWTYGVRYAVGVTVTDDILKLVCVSLQLVCWAWTAGFLLGSLARRTAWLHPALLIPVFDLCAVTVAALFSNLPHKGLGYLLPAAVLVLIPYLFGTHRGVRSGPFPMNQTMLLAAAIALLTLIVQIEGDREALAFAAWTSGGALDSRLIWTPRLLPFAAILWQFGLLTAITQWRKENI